MDDLDHKILTALAADSSVSTSRLSRRFGVARSTVQARIERLERSGAIAGYTIRLGPELTRRRIRATVLLTVEPRATAPVLAGLKALPAVEQVHTTSGRVDLILSVAVETTDDLDALLDQIGALNGVRTSESLVHLSTRIDRGA